MCGQPLFPTAVIGSMPRPQYVKDLLAARVRGGDDPPSSLQSQTDDSVRFVIGLQQQAGIDIISDGEWRRETYVDVIAEMLHGFEWVARDEFAYHQVVTRKVERRQTGLIAREAAFLRENTDRRIKVALPSPYLIGQRMWTAEHSRTAYATRQAFCEDLIPVLRDELLAVRDVGVDVIQLDEPHLCVLVDPEVRAGFADPESEMRRAVDWINAIVDGIENVTLAVHLCRRNWGRRGWGAAGGYEAILPHIQRLDVQQLMMEFSIPVAGDVAVLADLPDHFRIGLGCLDVRFPEVESPEVIVERVQKALRHVAPERITLSPDCGFSPGKDHGIPLDEAYNKLKQLAIAAEWLRENRSGC